MKPNMVMMTTRPTEKYPTPMAFLVYSTETKFKVLKKVNMREHSTIKLVEALYKKGYKTIGMWKRISADMIMIQILPKG